MKNQDVAARASKLRELLNDYRYNYHVLNKSTMSEAAADSLKHELSRIEDTYPDLITPDSPTQRVAGEPLPGFKPSVPVVFCGLFPANFGGNFFAGQVAVGEQAFDHGDKRVNPASSAD
jgi:hypothetical protein